MGEMETDQATESEVKEVVPNGQLTSAAANIEAERFLTIMFNLYTM